MKARWGNAVWLSLCGAAIALVQFAWAATPGCKQADAWREQAMRINAQDFKAALALLERSVAECPNSFHNWFLLGNAQREAETFGRAAEAYDQAVRLAKTPNNANVAQAWRALAWHQAGDTCKASRSFQALHRDGGPLPPWLREPYAAFARDMEENGIDADVLSCALAEDESTRSLGVCPRVALRIPFAFDSAAIDTAGETAVQALAEAIGRLQGRFRLVGHTDAVGAADYNQTLSERRATSVRTALQRLRPTLAGRLEVAGAGEGAPLVTGQAETDHRLNRRVEVKVMCGEV